MHQEHDILIRYRELHEKQDFNEFTRHIECARDLCPPNHLSCATALLDRLNLITTQLICCQLLDDMFPDFHAPPIGLRRTTLAPWLAVRSAYVTSLFKLASKGNGTKHTGKTAKLPGPGRFAVDPIRTTAQSSRSTVLPKLDIRQIIRDHFRTVQRWGAALEQMFHLDYCRHAFFDCLDICMRRVQLP